MQSENWHFWPKRHVVARHFWGKNRQHAFFDVRVFNPFARSYSNVLYYPIHVFGPYAYGAARMSIPIRDSRTSTGHPIHVRGAHTRMGQISKTCISPHVSALHDSTVQSTPEIRTPPYKGPPHFPDRVRVHALCTTEKTHYIATHKATDRNKGYWQTI